MFISIHFEPYTSMADVISTLISIDNKSMPFAVSDTHVICDTDLSNAAKIPQGKWFKECDPHWLDVYRHLRAVVENRKLIDEANRKIKHEKFNAFREELFKLMEAHQVKLIPDHDDEGELELNVIIDDTEFLLY